MSVGVCIINRNGIALAAECWHIYWKQNVLQFHE